MPAAMKDYIKNPDDMHVPHPDHVPIPTDRAMMDARKINPMDAAHVMDFGNLALGHPPASHKHVWLVDLAANVYGLDEIQGSDRPISVVVSVASVSIGAVSGPPLPPPPMALASLVAR